LLEEGGISSEKEDIQKGEDRGFGQRDKRTTIQKKAHGLLECQRSDLNTGRGPRGINGGVETIHAISDLLDGMRSLKSENVMLQLDDSRRMGASGAQTGCWGVLTWPVAGGEHRVRKGERLRREG